MVLVTGLFLWNGCAWARIGFLLLLALAILNGVTDLIRGPVRIAPMLPMPVQILFLLNLRSRPTREFCSH